MYYNNILEVIGNTPLVKLNKLNPNRKVHLLAKLEFLNPGGSIKDRIGLPMVKKAIEAGKLKKNGTIVEPTSGNTGVGLAMTAAVYGFKTVFIMPDKMSEEKRNLLRAYGAKVVITPTAVLPEDPRSYYKVSDRITRETPGAYKPDQYSNQSNPKAHFETTGPEIWDQTEGRVTHVVIGMGTGGTISGIGKFLKKKNPKIKIIGVDPEGSGYDHYFRTGRMPKVFKTYKVEGIGEDFLPATMDFSIVDEVITVTDADSFKMSRSLARDEGILAGGSSGLALFAARKVIRKLKKGLVVVIFPDSGKNYLTKFYNDDWMRDFGFLNGDEDTIKKLLNKKIHFISVDVNATPGEAVNLLKKFNISQLPVVENKKVVGIVSEGNLLNSLFGKEKIPVSVSDIMDRDFISLPDNSSKTQLAQALSKKEMVVITDKKGKPLDVLTRIDFLSNL